MTLPPFNPDAKCPKCGFEQITVRFKYAKPGQTLSRSEAVDAGASEWLLRHCERCQFNWDEACVEGNR